MEKKVIFPAAAAAIIAFLCSIFMGFGISVPPDVFLQPNVPPMAEAVFFEAIATYHQAMLQFFTADSLFVLSYIVVFAGLYTVAVSQSSLLAKMGLGVGLLTAVLDATENAFFITYASLAQSGVTVSEVALPLLYIVGNLKWMAAFATLLLFGLVWPRQRPLDWAVSILMLLFPLFGLLGIFTPGLVAWRGLFFLLGMPLFGWYFWQQVRQAAS